MLMSQDGVDDEVFRLSVLFIENFHLLLFI